MTTWWQQARRVLAAALAASMIAVVGVGAIAPSTAQAAGVVTDRHAAYASWSRSPESTS